MTPSYTRQVAVIAGAGSGIGRSPGLALARDEAALRPAHMHVQAPPGVSG